MIFVAIVWYEYTKNEFDIWKYTIDILWYYLILHKIRDGLSVMKNNNGNKSEQQNATRPCMKSTLLSFLVE